MTSNTTTVAAAVAIPISLALPISYTNVYCVQPAHLNTFSIRFADQKSAICIPHDTFCKYSNVFQSWYSYKEKTNPNRTPPIFNQLSDDFPYSIELMYRFFVCLNRKTTHYKNFPFIYREKNNSDSNNNNHNAVKLSPVAPDIDWSLLQVMDYFDCSEFLQEAQALLLSIPYQHNAQRLALFINVYYHHMRKFDLGLFYRHLISPIPKTPLEIELYDRFKLKILFKAIELTLADHKQKQQQQQQKQIDQTAAVASTSSPLSLILLAIKS